MNIADFKVNYLTQPWFPLFFYLLSNVVHLFNVVDRDSRKMSDDRCTSATGISGIVQNAKNNTKDSALNTALNLPEILRKILMFMCPGSLFSFMLVHKAAKDMLSNSRGIVLNSILYFTNMEPEGDEQAFERMQSVAF